MKEKTKKLIALIMAAVMLIGSGLTVGAAKADTSEKDDLKDIIDSNETLQAMTESMNLITYEAYKSKYGYIDDKDKLMYNIPFLGLIQMIPKNKMR